MKIKYSDTIQSLKSISIIENNKNFKQKLVVVILMIFLSFTVFYLLNENISVKVKHCQNIYLFNIKKYENLKKVFNNLTSQI